MSQMNLERARGLIGWTQSRLAREAHTSVSNIRDLENGENARPAYVLVMQVIDALRRGGLSALRPEDVFATESSSQDKVAS